MDESIDMGKMKISKLAWKISLPMIISMISIALYGIIDTIFVSKTGDSALTAISLAYPIQNVITAIGLGLSIGINSLLSRTLGEKNAEKCKAVIINGIKLTIISWVVVAIIIAIFSNLIFEFFTKNQEIIDLGATYIKILGIFSFGTLFQITFEKILEAHGKTKDSMYVQIIGAVINLILDPIFIFGFWIFKPMGIKGAAIATILGQIVGMIYGTYLVFFKYKMFNFSDLKNTRIEKSIVKDIYKVGFPTTLLEIVTSMIVFIFNKILIDFGDSAVDIWGIYERVQKFVLITIYGLNYGMIPIVGYNLGAKNYDRVKETIKYFLKISIAITAIGTIIFMIFPSTLVGWFTKTEFTINMGIEAFRVLGIGLIFAGVSLVLSATFQSFGNGSYSLIITMCRKIAITLPIVYLFKNTFGVSIFWWAVTIAEIVTMGIAILLFKKATKNYENKVVETSKY